MTNQKQINNTKRFKKHCKYISQTGNGFKNVPNWDAEDFLNFKNVKIKLDNNDL